MHLFLFIFSVCNNTKQKYYNQKMCYVRTKKSYNYMTILTTFFCQRTSYVFLLIFLVFHEDFQSFFHPQILQCNVPQVLHKNTVACNVIPLPSNRLQYFHFNISDLSQNREFFHTRSSLQFLF